MTRYRHPHRHAHCHPRIDENSWQPLPQTLTGGVNDMRHGCYLLDVTKNRYDVMGKPTIQRNRHERCVNVVSLGAETMAAMEIVATISWCVTTHLLLASCRYGRLRR